MYLEQTVNTSPVSTVLVSLSLKVSRMKVNGLVLRLSRSIYPTSLRPVRSGPTVPVTVEMRCSERSVLRYVSLLQSHATKVGLLSTCSFSRLPARKVLRNTSQLLSQVLVERPTWPCLFLRSRTGKLKPLATIL